MPMQTDHFRDSRNRTISSEAEEAELDPEKRQLKRRKDALIEYFRGYIGETFYRLGASSEKQKDELWKGLLSVGLNEEEIARWEADKESYYERARASAQQLKGQLDSLLNRAVEAHYISTTSRERWIGRFRDPAVDYKAKEYFVQNQMPAYFDAWQSVAERRKAVLQDSDFLLLEEKEVRKLGSFLKEEEFLDLHYEKRLGLVAAAEAALLSLRQRALHLHARAKERLENAAKARALSAGRVGLWLLHIVEKYPSLSERERFVDVTLKSYISDWVKVRTKYEEVDAKMKERGVPQGFHRLSLSSFLQLSYEQRLSYVEMARERLDMKQGGTTPEMENLKLGIRHALDTEDWEEAEDLLRKARKLLQGGGASEKDRFELDSMERYLKAFRSKEKEKQQPMEDVRQTLEQMRIAFAQIPLSLQPLYLAAMNDPELLGAVASCVYNRVWCREHGYLNDAREQMLRETSVEETQRLAHGPHKKRGLDNVRLGVVTDPEQPSSVRTYTEGEWGPTIIHMPPGTHGHFLQILQSRKNNYAFRYWTTLIPFDVSYAQQYHLVKNVNWVLKSGVKKLKKMGFLFTLTGHPIPLN